MRNIAGPSVSGANEYARVYHPSARGRAAYRHRKATNAAATMTLIAANVVAKRAAGRRVPDAHSITTQPSDIGMSATLVSFVV